MIVRMKKMIKIKFDYIIVFILNYKYKMFEGISLSDYDLTFELQRSQFLKECLQEEILFQLNNDEIVIYKKTNIKIMEQITINELIYFIQYEVAETIHKLQDHINDSLKITSGKREDREKERLRNNEYIKKRDVCEKFKGYFRSIDNIRKYVEYIKIILENEDDEDEEGAE